MKEDFTREGLKRLRKEAALIDTALKGVEIASNFKPFTDASRTFFRNGGMDYIKAHTKPIAHKIYNNVGTNNQMKLDYAKNRATDIFNTYKPAVDKVSKQVYNKIPAPIKSLKGAKDFIDRGLTNVGKV